MLEHDLHAIMDASSEVVGGRHDQGAAQTQAASFNVFPFIPWFSNS
jgi:hypothetical protein